MNYFPHNILCTIFFLALLPTKIFAQSTYVPFPKEEAVWTVYHHEPYEPFWDNAQYILVGDTLINGLIYNKLSSKDEYIGNVSDYGIVGYLRQDVAQKKIYFLPANNYEIETLLYDFDLQIGDSVPITYHSDQSGYKVVQDDSILLNTGYRRMLVLFPDGGLSLDTVKIVEGMGSLSGILTPISRGNCFEFCYQLECFRAGDQILYSTSIATCNVLGIDNTYSGKMKGFIQPNPVMRGENVNLTVVPETRTEVSIFDLFGNIIWSKKYLHESSVKIPTNNLSAGIYTIRILADEGLPISKKLIVQ